MEINLLGEKLSLQPEKIIYWEKEKIIFIADFHLGKTTHFRKSGIAIPTNIINAEIDRVAQIIEKYNPNKIIFLGDLFHSDLNREWSIFNDFISAYQHIKFILIKGNHDILPERIYELSQLQIENEPFDFHPFILSHHPITDEQIPEQRVNLCGHIHPGVSISGKARSREKLACFFQEDKKIILPAFGKFTGTAKMNPKKNDNVYIILSKSVTKL